MSKARCCHCGQPIVWLNNRGSRTRRPHDVRGIVLVLDGRQGLKKARSYRPHECVNICEPRETNCTGCLGSAGDDNEP